jgi:DnaJ-class molecular chaperone
MEINNSKNLYDILNVSKESSDDDIKKAYRKLAVKHHPDKTGSSDDKMFKAISQAYEILSNPEKRRIYDETGNIENIDDILKQREFFNGFFNPFGGQNIIRFNPDINMTIRLELDEIYSGKTLEIVIKRNVVDINGSDNKTETENITIFVEPGVGNGEIIHLRGKGNKLIENGEIKKVGNVKLIIEEISHKIFKRSPYQKSHIYMNVKISLFQALIGEFDFIITGLCKEKISLNIGKNIIKPGTVLCINGKGMKNINNGSVEYGNLYIIIDIEFPNELTDEQRTILKTTTNYMVTKSKKTNCDFTFTDIDKLNKLLMTNEHSENYHNNVNNEEFGGIECTHQ